MRLDDVPVLPQGGAPPALIKKIEAFNEHNLEGKLLPKEQSKAGFVRCTEIVKVSMDGLRGADLVTCSR